MAIAPPQRFDPRVAVALPPQETAKFRHRVHRFLDGERPRRVPGERARPFFGPLPLAEEPERALFLRGEGDRAGLLRILATLIR